MDFMDWDSYLVFNLKNSRSKVYVEVYDGIVSILNLETRCSSSAASQIQWWVPTVLFFWLFSPAWDAVQLTLQVGFICPFVVIDPTDFGATIVVAQAVCLTIFNLSPTQKTCLFTDGNKSSVCVTPGTRFLCSHVTRPQLELGYECECDS